MHNLNSFLKTYFINCDFSVCKHTSTWTIPSAFWDMCIIRKMEFQGWGDDGRFKSRPLIRYGYPVHCAN